MKKFSLLEIINLLYKQGAIYMNNDRDFHSILWFAVVIEENGGWFIQAERRSHKD